MPTWSINLKSFLDFGTGSHSITLPTLISSFSHSSNSIFSLYGAISTCSSDVSSISAASSRSFFSISILANSTSAFSTFVPAFVTPKVFTLSYDKSQAFICFAIFSAVWGIYELSKDAIILIVSIRLYNTVPSLGIDASSFANTQGVVSSMYLFARFTTFQISSKLSATWKVDILSSIAAIAPVAVFIRSSSKSPLTSPD